MEPTSLSVWYFDNKVKLSLFCQQELPDSLKNHLSLGSLYDPKLQTISLLVNNFSNRQDCSMRPFLSYGCIGYVFEIERESDLHDSFVDTLIKILE